MPGFFDLVDGVFSLSEVFSVEGIWSSTGILIVVDILGDGAFLGKDFSGVVSIGGVGSFVEDDGGVCVNETDEDLGGDVIGETDGVFEGDGGVDGSFSSMDVGLTLGESSMTSSSS